MKIRDGTLNMLVFIFGILLIDSGVEGCIIDIGSNWIPSGVLICMGMVVVYLVLEHMGKNKED